MSANPTFNEVSDLLPIGDFIRLIRHLESPETKKYTRTIASVVRKNRGDNGGQVGLIRYQPATDCKFQDPGEIPTNWLTDPLAMLVCNVAKGAIGKRCLIYQANKDQSEEQPTGFRECVWIQILEDPK